MRRLALPVLVVVSCSVAVLSFVTSAQVIDSTPCERSCYEEQSSCITECGAHTNPIECEATCRDELRDCIEQCR